MATNKEEDVEDESSEIEFILEDIGGSYGKFQIMNYILFAIPIGISGIFGMTYVFTTLNLDYRYMEMDLRHCRMYI